MTGTIDDTFSVSDSADDGSGRGRRPLTPATTAAVVEQAKGVLIFRYGVDADAAYSLLELWAAEAGFPVEDVACAVVHDICQGRHDDATEARLVRWLEERLRHEPPVAGVPVTPLDG